MPSDDLCDRCGQKVEVVWDEYLGKLVVCPAGHHDVRPRFYGRKVVEPTNGLDKPETGGSDA